MADLIRRQEKTYKTPAKPQMYTHMGEHKHTNTSIGTFKVFRGALGGCVFSSEENLATIISTQVAADIMNWAFQT